MKAIETPVGKCFSKPDMEGSFYHEFNESNEEPHTFHRYDKDGNYVLYSTIGLSKMTPLDEFYLSNKNGEREGKR